MNKPATPADAVTSAGSDTPSPEVVDALVAAEWHPLPGSPYWQRRGQDAVHWKEALKISLKPPPPKNALASTEFWLTSVIGSGLVLLSSSDLDFVTRAAVEAIGLPPEAGKIAYIVLTLLTTGIITRYRARRDKTKEEASKP